MNKKQKAHKSIVSGNAKGVRVVESDIACALRTFKKQIKQSGVLDHVKNNRTFTKPSVKRRDVVNRAKHIQYLRDQEYK